MKFSKTILATCIAATVTACGVRQSAPSTLRGTVALSTFSTSPPAVVAVDETGHATSSPISADGSFALALAKNHSYKLRIGDVPMVFPRASGRLDLAFALRTDGAALSLGLVRRRGGAPAGGFVIVASKAAEQRDCTDCVSDDPRTICEDDGESREENGSMEDDGEQADASAEMAVGDQNVPDQVEGCDGNDVEQEGEH